MPPKKTETTQGQDGAAAGNATLNPVQMNFLALLMQHTRSKPDIDWDSVAKGAGITAKSAQERYRLMSIKFGWNTTSAGGPSTPGTKKGTPNAKTPNSGKVTKKTGRVGKKGKKAAEEEDEEDEEEQDELAQAYGGDIAGEA